MDNEKKCDKYEGLFVFRTEEELNEHINNCPDCKQEHETQLKVSKLIKEVAPEYLAKRAYNKTNMLKKAACFVMAFSIISAYGGYKVYDEYRYQAHTIIEDSSYINELGLPTDDYGFFEI